MVTREATSAKITKKMGGGRLSAVRVVGQLDRPLSTLAKSVEYGLDGIGQAAWHFRSLVRVVIASQVNKILGRWRDFGTATYIGGGSRRPAFSVNLVRLSLLPGRRRFFSLPWTLSHRRPFPIFSFSVSLKLTTSLVFFLSLLGLLSCPRARVHLPQIGRLSSGQFAVSVRYRLSVVRYSNTETGTHWIQW